MTEPVNPSRAYNGEMMSKAFQEYKPWKSVNPQFNPVLQQVHEDDDSLYTEQIAEPYYGTMYESTMLLNAISGLILAIKDVPGQMENVQKLANFATESIVGKTETIDEKTPETVDLSPVI